ncbi:hypothetical protein OG754_33870 [Streptomyces decoyicus]|uniref:hypothetical protein n=1 Tax=Streptomyces decoyicus TaxID=249567 RepID=UPI002E34E94F|nr:hypothetical protein [Streptomyces decoyicus]
MPVCIHCGARFEDSAAVSCTGCGMPRQRGVPEGTGQPHGATGYGYVRVGSTILPQWLLWVMAALLAGGGVTAYALASSAGSSEPSYEAVGGDPSTTPTPSWDLASGPPTDVATAPPTDIGSVPPTDVYSPDTPDPSPSPDDASAIVEEFYRDINNRDFSAAWDLGGRNIGGKSYSAWVAGYDTTASIELSAVNADSAGQVSAVVHATQSDGSVKLYQGTYTVSDGEIVSADISER